MNTLERLMSKVVQSDTPTLGEPCWIFVGAGSGAGYRSIWAPKADGVYTVRRAHRVAYELLVGPIPEGLPLDHLCSIRACVNPSHLEPVTPAENVRRSIHVRNRYCPQGHEFNDANTYRSPSRGHRYCRECHRRKQREYVERKKAAA